MNVVVANPSNGRTIGEDHDRSKTFQKETIIIGGEGGSHAIVSALSNMMMKKREL